MDMVLADPIGSILAPLVNCGEQVKPGSWLVEGMGEDFVPDILDLKLVKTATPSPTANHSTARDLLKKEGILVGSSTGYAAGGRAAVLPRAGFAQTRRDLRRRLRHQVPVQGVRRLLADRARACRTREHGDLRDLVARSHRKAARSPSDRRILSSTPMGACVAPRSRGCRSSTRASRRHHRRERHPFAGRRLV